MIALAIFAGTYLVLAIGGLPGFRIDRTGAAIIGASLMVGFNVLTFEEAIQAVDHSTLVLLFGMMIVVANLRLSGPCAGDTVARAREPGPAHQVARDVGGHDRFLLPRLVRWRRWPS